MSDPAVQPPAVNRTIVVASKKSMGVALILTILFGPLGLLYASVPGGIILIILTLVIALITFGIGALVGWLASIIWAAIAVSSHNRKVDAMASKY